MNVTVALQLFLALVLSTYGRPTDSFQSMHSSSPLSSTNPITPSNKQSVAPQAVSQGSTSGVALNGSIAIEPTALPVAYLTTSPAASPNSTSVSVSSTTPDVKWSSGKITPSSPAQHQHRQATNEVLSPSKHAESQSESILSSFPLQQIPSSTAQPKIDTKNVFEWLVSSSIHTVFVDMIREASLTEFFSTTQNIVVFAPTNDGFLNTLRDFRYKKEKRPRAVSQFWSLLFKKNKQQLNLTRLVLYHAAHQKLTRQGILSQGYINRFLTTKSGDTLELKEYMLQDNAKSLPNPYFTKPDDERVSNGIVHSLNRVLIPINLDRNNVTTEVTELEKIFRVEKRSTCFLQQQELVLSQLNKSQISNLARPSNSKNVFEMLDSSPQYSIFTTFIRKAKLTDFFSSTQNISVFAPTNAGFLATLRDFRYKGEPKSVLPIWSYLTGKQKDIFNLNRIVMYHTALQRLTSKQIDCLSTHSEYRFLETKSGDMIELNRRILQDKAKSLPNPKLTEPLNLQSSNGIVHSINRVLIPTNIDREVVTAAVANMPTSSEKDNVNTCFPLSATVRAADGTTIAMRDLAAGSHIHVSEANLLSPVFLFSHRVLTGMYDFVRISTQSGHSIAMTPGHYIYANGRLAAASSVRVGDSLRTVDGLSRVVAIDIVRERGLVAPHTVHGDIVVDGIVSSTYTTAVDPSLAQTMLAPMRAVVRLGLATNPLGTALYNGADNLVSLLPGGPKWC